MLALRELRNAILCRDRSAALITVASEVLERYGNEKQRRGLVDYDDLIDKALDLLRNTDAAWVHYKLDLGIDHLLIDEAQDTSTKQWEIVQRLVEEFTAGAGARPGTRTIFAVGDEKQSIFSFQNAAPREFAEMRKYFQKRHEDSGLKFEYRQLEHSFRSCESVLGAVDIVFKDIAGSVTVGFPRRHSAAHRAARCAARRGRNLGHHQAGEARADRRLGRAVRHRERGQPAREAGAPHRPHRAPADRCARAGRP